MNQSDRQKQTMVEHAKEKIFLKRWVFNPDWNSEKVTDDDSELGRCVQMKVTGKLLIRECSDNAEISTLSCYVTASMPLTALTDDLFSFCMCKFW